MGRSNQVTTVGSQFQMSVVESCGSLLDGRGEENVGAKPISRISQRCTEGELRKRACNKQPRGYGTVENEIRQAPRNGLVEAKEGALLPQCNAVTSDGGEVEEGKATK